MNAKLLFRCVMPAVAVCALNLYFVRPALADYPATQTTIHLRASQAVDATHYHVHAVVYTHGAALSEVQFAVSGRWGSVGQYEGRLADGGLVFGVITFGHPGNSLQARSWVSGRIDDY